MLGRLLHLAVVQAPGLAKAWSQLGDRAYACGLRAVEQARDQRDKTTELTADETRAVDTVLLGVGERERRAVQRCVAQLSLRESHLAGHKYERWDFMRRELLETGALGEVSDAVVQQLVVIWQAVFRRVYAHYDLAAESYFRHLQLGGHGSCSRPGTISATLRLLHLAVTHPLELSALLPATAPPVVMKYPVPYIRKLLN